MQTVQTDLSRTVTRLQSSLRHLICSLGLDPDRPQTVTHGLGIDKTLAWKLCRLTREDEPLAAVAYLPGRAGLDAALHAAARSGGDEADVRDALGAAEAVRLTVETHAGNRETFTRLAASMETEAGSSRLGASLRRQAFRANAAIWGVQARSRVAIQFVAPNAKDPARVAIAIVSGLVDVLRLRPSVRWPISTFSSFGCEGVAEPLDPESRADVPLLAAFSSPNLPPLRSMPIPSGTIVELVEGQLGRTGALTCLFGLVKRSFAPAAGAPGECGEYFSYVQTPSESALLELHVHRSLDFGLPPEFRLYSCLESVTPLDPDESRRYLLPTSESVSELKAGRQSLATPLLPRHAELADVAARRLGHALSDFRTFRVVLNHPPVPTIAAFRHALVQRRGPES